MAECCICEGRQTVQSLLAAQRGGEGEHPVCRDHWREMEQAWALSLWSPHVVTAAPGSAPCPVCEGVETIEGREWLECQSAPNLTPLCGHHAKQLADCRVDTSRIRTPPVSVNCPAVGAVVSTGN